MDLVAQTYIFFIPKHEEKIIGRLSFLLCLNHLWEKGNKIHQRLKVI